MKQDIITNQWILMFSKSLIKKQAQSFKKNTVRKVTKETKEIVYERDGGKCVFCKRPTQDHFHHIYWWMESEYSENRNDPDRLVLACYDCHTICHTKETKKYRLLWKEYIKNICKNTEQNQ